ncbi:MAG TPA: patatin-like phospholipase family protein [Nitrospira sp.]|nr:patatin-like phospholipase family protein [Nitrospira sp.]
MSTAQDYITHPEVLKALQTVKKECKGKEYSDIIDAGDHQYVDLVMEGGGALGIALTGYTYLLEQAGIRFLGVGGTSAGSINALMIAALGPPGQAKSERLLDVLSRMPMETFIDGDSDARDFSQAVLDKAGMVKLIWKASQIIDNLKEDLGLNPGDAFLNWPTAELQGVGIKTTEELLAQLRTVSPGLRLRTTRTDTELSEKDKGGDLVMIVADITIETKVEFPRMAGLYWCNPEPVNPAYFARASMSIPFFFHPFTVNDCSPNRSLWRDLAGYEGTPPQHVMFMDGGIMSNFPINVFHQPYRVPTAPIFGAKIGIEGTEPTEITKPSQLLGAVFDAARHTLDDDFIKANPDYKHLVKMIDTGSHHWLNFTMSHGDKIDLFARGAKAAAEFLCAFDWSKYKTIRKGLAEAFQASVGNGPAKALG